MGEQSIPELIKAGKYAEVLSSAPEAVGLLPGFETIQLYRGLALMGTGELFVGGLAVLNSCQRQPQSLQELEQDWALPPQAQKAVEDLLQLLGTPPPAEPDLTLASIDWSDRSGKDQAGACYYFNACATQLEAGSLEKALQAALRSWKCAPNYNAGMMAATLTARLGDPRAALPVWDQALQCDGVDPIRWGARGELKMQLGDHQGALSDLDRAVREAPESPYPLLSRANLKLKLGDRPGGRADRELAYRIEPRLRPARFPIGMFLLLLGVIVTFLSLMVLMLRS